jgi:hypothetical protein
MRKLFVKVADTISLQCHGMGTAELSGAPEALATIRANENLRMNYEGSGEVTLFTPNGDVVQHREVIIDAPGDRAVAKITVVGPPMKAVHAATAIRVVANGTRYEFALVKAPAIAAEQTVFWQR